MVTEFGGISGRGLGINTVAVIIVDWSCRTQTDRRTDDGRWTDDGPLTDSRLEH